MLLSIKSVYPKKGVFIKLKPVPRCNSYGRVQLIGSKLLVNYYIFTQKLQERRSTLTKSAMSPKEKEKWGKVLVPEMMSSEESDVENDDIITVKPISWRAERVRTFLHRLDSKVTTAKSVQSKRQQKQRVESSENSNRVKPATLPDWAVVN